MNVYRKAEYEKKDLLSKIGHGSGQKAKATQKEVPVMSPANVKCTYGMNGEHTETLEAPFVQPMSWLESLGARVHISRVYMVITL